MHMLHEKKCGGLDIYGTSLRRKCKKYLISPSSAPSEVTLWDFYCGSRCISFRKDAREDLGVVPFPDGAQRHLQDRGNRTCTDDDKLNKQDGRRMNAPPRSPGPGLRISSSLIPPAHHLRELAKQTK
jgi:hypothetical protein